MKSTYRQQYSNASHDNYFIHWLLPLQHAALGKHYSIYKLTSPRAAGTEGKEYDTVLSLSLLIP